MKQKAKPKQGVKKPSSRPVSASGKKPVKRSVKKRKIKREHKWEKGDYAQMQEMKLILPWQFLYVCKLTAVTPKEVLNQFLDDLGQESFKRSENPATRQTLIEYFIQRGWGQDFYTETDIRKMFAELDAIGSLWPKDARLKWMEQHARWRNKYHRYWFKKWYRKIRRKKL